jgi:2-oxoacid:acceptor oxidoreductase gamma subunit (pyruvate/2-ketoisovalerate family)
MIEIIVHGRGGQGAVTFSQILAIAANCCGRYCQAFPSFGPERCGAPVEAFVRISEDEIHLRSEVYNPDIVVVLDVSLLSQVDVTKNLKKNGILIVNSNQPVNKLKINNKNNFKIYSIDATAIALKTFGKDISNTAMLGAFAAITNIVSLDSVNKGLEQRFEDSNILQLNKKTVSEVYEKALQTKK